MQTDFRSWRVWAAVLLLAAMMAIRAPGVAVAQEQSVTPTSGPAGTTFTFRLSGFDNGERVGYWLNVPNGTVLAIGNNSTYAPSGQLTVVWTSQVGVPLGFWQLVAVGVSSDRQRVVPFEVTAAPGNPVAGTTSVTPSVGTLGTTFVFAAAGFHDGERIGYWLNAPTGGILPLDDLRHYADQNGRFELQWTAPPFAATGKWQLVVQGTSSGIGYVIPFEVR